MDGKQILVTRSSMPDFDEYCKEIEGLWDSRWLTNSGVKYKQLECELKKFLSVENVSLYTNGHLALENIISAMQLSGEVITTPFTFASTTNAIVRSGLTPVFCDINKDDYTIDVNKIEALITPKTSAIIPVHVYGNICDYKKIDEIAKRHKLAVIYDAAHAFGVKCNGISAANIGDAAMFSFHATKVYNTIEGGAVCYKDGRLSSRLESIKNFGLQQDGDISTVGGNAKMNEFQAAMGICNLRHVKDEIAKREKVYLRYKALLGDVGGIKFNHIQDGVISNYAYMPIVFYDYKYNRDTVFEKLKENGIIARKYFSPTTNSFKYIENAGIKRGQTPVADTVSQSVLCLPMYADLPLDEVDRICGIILK